MKTTNGVSSTNTNSGNTKKLARTKSESVTGFNLVNFNYKYFEK